MFLELITLIVSLIVLAKSADAVVSSTVKLSNFFGISHLTISFLLIAMLTSLPELSVSVASSQAGQGAIAAGNVFGSNIANILLLLGMGAFLYGMKIKKSELKDVSIVLALTTIISAYIIFSSILFGRALDMIEGIVLVVLFLIYSQYMLRNSRVSRNSSREMLRGSGTVHKHEAFYAFLYFTFSIIMVLVSASFVVNSAVRLATLLGVAESFLGATIIAVGTSLPELSVILQAVRRKKYGVALGTAIGSNMANITFVLGVAALINPITIVLPVFIAALLFAVVANTMLFYAAAVDQRLEKFGGLLFLLVYIVYLLSIFYLQITEKIPAV